MINKFNFTWKKYNIFILYYIIGVISSLAMVAYPLLFIQRGFTSTQIVLLISISFIASIFQPLIGYIADSFLTNLKTLKYLFIIYLITCLIMFFYPPLFIISFSINSLMRTGMPALIDSYYNSSLTQFDFSFAKVRTSMPIGLGTAFFVANIFITIFHLSINGVLLFLAIISILAIIIIISLPEQATNTKNSSNPLNQQTNFSNIFLLILYSLLYAGMYQVTSSYLSLYFSQFGYSTHFIGSISMLMLLPQIFLMINYDKLFSTTKNSTIMLLAALFGIVQLIIYITSPHNIIFLAFASLAGGIQLVLFPAGFYPLLTQNFNSNKTSIGLTLNSTIQALGVGLLNTIVISDIYNQNQNTIDVYFFATIVMLLSFIPVLIYKYKNSN